MKRVLMVLLFFIGFPAHAGDFLKNLSVDLTAHHASVCSGYTAGLPYVQSTSARDDYFNSFARSQSSLLSCAYERERDITSHTYRYQATTWWRLDKSSARRTRMVGLGFEFSTSDSSTRFGLRGQRIILMYVLEKNLL